MFGKKKTVEEQINKEKEQGNKYGYLDVLKENYMNRLLFYHSVSANFPTDINMNDSIIVYYIHDIKKGDENNYDGTWKLNFEVVSALYDRRKKEFVHANIDSGEDTIVGTNFFNRTFLPYVVDGETPYETFTKIKEKYQKIKDKITEREEKKKEAENERIYSFLKIDDE